MTMEAIVLIVIVILLVGVSAYCTFLDYKHYNPYTEVVFLNNNSFIIDYAPVDINSLYNG